MIKINTYDNAWFFLISSAPPLLAAVAGDYLYAGIWDYIAIPVVGWLIAIFLHSSTGYLSGLAIGLVLNFILFSHINWLNDHQDGGVGLAHLTTLPGIFLGMIFSSRNLVETPEKTVTKTIFISCSSVLTIEKHLHY